LILSLSSCKLSAKYGGTPVIILYTIQPRAHISTAGFSYNFLSEDVLGLHINYSGAKKKI
jgi:hypothetical protein